MKSDLNSLTSFATVAKYRNFRRAALDLGVSASALSHSLSKLEDSLGVRLLNRSTRSVNLTDAGETLLRSLAPALMNIDQALEDLNEVRVKPRGRLRLNVPRSGAQLILAPKLAAWKAQFPDLELDIVTNDGLIDIVKEGFDAGMRFGESLQQDMIAVPVGPKLRFAACASPAYLQQYGRPKTPQDLFSHHCLQYRFSNGSHYAWEFESKKKRLEVSTNGSIASDDFFSLVRAAVDGAGICYTYFDYVQSFVASGQLNLILEDWMPVGERMYLYFPSRSQLPLSLRALIDFLK